MVAANTLSSATRGSFVLALIFVGQASEGRNLDWVWEWPGFFSLCWRHINTAFTVISKFGDSSPAAWVFLLARHPGFAAAIFLRAASLGPQKGPGLKFISFMAVFLSFHRNST